MDIQLLVDAPEFWSRLKDDLYHILEELVVMTRDRDMLGVFVARAWEPDLAAARHATPVSSRGTRLGDAAVRLGASLAWAIG